jgi:hypothetical protein
MLKAAMQTFTIDLDISAAELARWYRGSANVVRACSRDGRWLQFPATVLRPFVTRDGIKGTFAVAIDDERKLLGFRKVPMAKSRPEA